MSRIEDRLATLTGIAIVSGITCAALAVWAHIPAIAEGVAGHLLGEHDGTWR